MTLKILDLYCGAGGAAFGIKEAAKEENVPIEILGIDIKNKSHTYPFDFFQGNATRFPLGKPGAPFDFIWASPPCQRHSTLKAFHWTEGPDLIEFTREKLEEWGGPWAIENVPDAPLNSPIELCGTMFEGLRVIRHRHFEISGFTCLAPPHPNHDDGLPKGYMTIAGHFTGRDNGREAMGIPWMSRNDLAQAIPPAYSQYIFGAFLRSGP